MNTAISRIKAMAARAASVNSTAPVEQILKAVIRILELEFERHGRSHPSAMLSATEAAELEGVSTRTIRNRCQEGDYPGAELTRGDSGHWRIPLKDLERRRKSLRSRAKNARGSPLADIPSYRT